MEDLNNRQMILLTMFTSFVISIATGIITVAMLQVAPETVTQTVNHVVEHTIERIVAGTTTPEKPSSVVTNNVTKEVTVYAKEDDLVVSTVEKNQSRVVAIYAKDTASSSAPLATGFVASRDGLVVSSTRGLLQGAPAATSYFVTIGERGFVAEAIAGQDETRPVFFLRIVGLGASTTLDAMTYGRGDAKLGKTVVALGTGDGAGIQKVTLAKLRTARSESTTTPATLIGFETVPRIGDQYLGSPVVDLDGQLIGVVVPDQSDETRTIVYPVMRVLDAIGALPSQTSLGDVPEGRG